MNRLRHIGAGVGIFLGLSSMLCFAQEREQPVPPDVPGPVPRSVRDQALEQRKRPVARLGVAVREIAADSDPHPTETGLEVIKVVAGSPAAEAGLEPGDRLTHFDDQILIVPKQLEVLVKRSAVGAKISLLYQRSGERRSAAVTLDEAPRDQPVRPENVIPDDLRVTRRVVRVTAGSTTLTLSTRAQQAYLVIADEDEILFEGPVTKESEIPSDMRSSIDPVADLKNGQWAFKLPLLPPVELEPEQGPRPPAPEED